VVLLFHNYDAREGTNEHALLDGLAGRGGCEPGIAGVARFHHDALFDAYRISPPCGAVAR
jgi:hypothetical protein